MSALWEIVEQEPRYPLPKMTLKYRDHLRGYARLALDEMVKLYRKSPNKPVAITARQFAKLCGVSRATAQRSINSLIDAGFIALVAKGTYERKRLPSRYRMTMFPCGSIEPTHDYIDDIRDWNRQDRRRGQARPKPTTRLTVFSVPLASAPALAEAVAGVLSSPSP
jgi:hypothetical protein